ncbi:MAG TPA: MarR family winged helix-turn-helix transcriptional regulator [Ideonella sp.]|uniref:MarR family winged helix-turn-helix transcriptional regulator n=1 Tax=Ideonella sp. TaxID=1929293 RepID=UPI002CC33709|nr:MarR family winged helix-turn-helix transcriptional regulator [Ideonella sp.]HSI51390.1 MarR family winged helix-turn-helix transcriptional regulator [Ideonella sp.]
MKRPATEPPALAEPPALPRGCSNLRLRQADRLVSLHFDGVIQKETGLKTSQYSLLGHIAAMGPVRPADLAAAMALQPSTLTRNLQPLVAQGWVQMGPGADARSRSISLTDAGQAKRQQARQSWKRAQLAFNQRMGAERVARLHALLDEVIQLMNDTPEPT